MDLNPLGSLVDPSDAVVENRFYFALDRAEDAGREISPRKADVTALGNPCNRLGGDPAMRFPFRFTILTCGLCIPCGGSPAAGPCDQRHRSLDPKSQYINQRCVASVLFLRSLPASRNGPTNTREWDPRFPHLISRLSWRKVEYIGRKTRIPSSGNAAQSLYGKSGLRVNLRANRRAILYCWNQPIAPPMTRSTSGAACRGAVSVMAMLRQF